MVNINILNRAENKFMSTIELKNRISSRLTTIEDFSFLQSIHNLIESRFDDKIYKLSEQQKLRVEDARIDYITENTQTNDEVLEEIGNWLNSK